MVKLMAVSLRAGRPESCRHRVTSELDCTWASGVPNLLQFCFFVCKMESLIKLPHSVMVRIQGASGQVLRALC